MTFVRTSNFCFIPYTPAPSDYLPGPYNVTFTARNTTATVDIPIVNDGIYEANIGLENFTATISTIYPGGCSVSAGPDNTATVFIRDNEGIYLLCICYLWYCSSY